MEPQKPKSWGKVVRKLPEVSDPYRHLLEYSLKLLASRAYSESKLRDKLLSRAKKFKIEDVREHIEKVTARLHELKYLDDEKFAKNYLSYHMATRPEGRYGFLSRMKKVGIPSAVALPIWNATLHNSGSDERELARELMRSRMRTLEKFPPQKRKQKMAALLARRGFSADVVWEVVASL